MMTRAALAMALALGLAACATKPSQIAPGVTLISANTPPGSDEIKFAVKNPDPERWTAQIRQATPTGSVRLGYTCKVLACPEPLTVVVSNSVPGGAKPDKKALEKLAKEILPKLTQARNLELQVASDNKAKIETLSSATARFNRYDGVLNETKITVNDRVRHNAIAIITAGRAVVTISADGADRASTRKAVDEFSRNVIIEEGPPL